MLHHTLQYYYIGHYLLHWPLFIIFIIIMMMRLWNEDRRIDLRHRVCLETAAAPPATAHRIIVPLCLTRGGRKEICGPLRQTAQMYTHLTLG